MGYRIVYGPEVRLVSGRTGSTARLRTMIAGAFLLFSILVRLTWQEGAEAMQKLFLPGDLTVTEQAFSEMVTDLRDGETVKDAVVVFCQRILDEAS